jgi:hypothetical protein
MQRASFQAASAWAAIEAEASRAPVEGGVNMTTYHWIVCGLGVFDTMLLALWFVLLRSPAFRDRQTRVITAIALSGFIFHAVIFFEGAILYLQLTTLAGIYLGLALWPPRQRPADGSQTS